MFLVMNNIKFATILALVALFFVACSEDSGSTNNALPEDSVKTGTFIDERDGQVYKTVTIGEQTWMAENLNFEYQAHGESYGNYCNMGDCKAYGRYYIWEVAINVCPTGWHLPDTTEWLALYRAIGEDPYAMQATGFGKWGNATNASGFSALPAGHWGGEGVVEVGWYASFWSAAEDNLGRAYFWNLDAGYAYFDINYKDYGYSVRCLQKFLPDKEISSSSVDTGSLIDERDGQIYKTVTIGSQTWMAENLNYDFKLHGESYDNYCYMDHCTIYGRYYTWEVALNVCPTGWHLPDTTEWHALYRAIGEDPYAMQAMGVVKWENATNASGFSALPAGGGSFGPGYNNYVFKEVESCALFWSATKQEKSPFSTLEYAYRWYVDSDIASVTGESVANGLSVRCLKD